MVSKLIFCVVFSLILPACGGKVLYERHLDFVKIKKADHAVPESQVKQPQEIDGAKLHDMLATLKFSKRHLIAEDIQNARLFDETILGWMVPALIEGFRRAKASEWLVFSCVDPEPRVLLRRDYWTVGRMWLTEGYLHIEFLRLRALVSGDYKREGRDYLLRQAKAVRVSVELGPGQTRSTNPDEVVLDFKTDYSLIAAAESPDMSPKERLKALEDLKREKLITEDEYQKKREEILKQL